MASAGSVNPNITSTDPPTDPNPVGDSLNGANAAVLVLMTIVVGMRLWGRYRYRTPASMGKATYGEPRYWIFWSDVTIIVSWVTALGNAICLFLAVRWGLGLHVKQLGAYQLSQEQKMFYVYQVLYKFCSGIAKVATLLLLLAISTPQMTTFNLFCKLFAVYIMLYCIATSITTIFMCGTDIDSNWIFTHSQAHCFYKVPFWYSHAAINLSATFVMAVLPWWLFAHITYKRKYVIASIMTILALAETALSGVRFWGLTRSAAGLGDITFSATTGNIVSQLEIDFATIAACIPTVLRMLEEFWVLINVHVFRRQITQTGSGGESGDRYATNGRRTQGGVHLSDLRSVQRDPKPTGPYSSFDKDGDDGSMDSQEQIVKKAGNGGIKIDTEYTVTVVEKNNSKPGGSAGVSFYDDERDQPGKGFSTKVVAR